MAKTTWLDEIREAAERNTLRRLEDAKRDKEPVEEPKKVEEAKEPVKK